MAHAAPAPVRLRRPSHPPPSCARCSPTDPSCVRPNGCVWRCNVARPCLSSKPVRPNSFIYSPDPAPAAQRPWMGQAGGQGRREVVTLSLVFILSYVSPGARKNPKHVPIGPHKCRQAAEGYPVSPRSERAVALTSWGSRPSLPNEYNVFILCTCDALETDWDYSKTMVWCAGGTNTRVG